MTITTTENRVSANGNGVTMDFAFNKFVEDPGDLEIWLRSLDGTETLQVLSAQYSLSGIGSAAITVHMNIAPENGSRLVMIRKEPLTNEVAIDDAKSFRSQAFEQQFDRVARGLQNVADQTGRALQLSVTDIDDVTASYDAKTRTISNLAGGVSDLDAVNKSQLEAAVADGQEGPKGERGPQAGHAWNWDNAISDSDKGKGKVWVNNGVLSDASILFFDNLNQTSDDVTLWLARLDDSTSTNDRGTIYLEREGDKSNWAEYQVIGSVIAAGTYYKVPVSYLGSGGSFTPDDVIIAQFSRTGNAGAGDGDFKRDGSVAMTGDLDAGGNDISNVGTVDGRDVSADGALLDALNIAHKYDATDAPTLSDDSANTSGNGVFSVGSRWIDLTNDEIWLCVDASVSAAAWKNVSLDITELGTGALLDESSAAQFRSNVADKLLSTDQVWNSAEEIALTYGANISVDMSTFINAGLTLPGNAVLENPTNKKTGQQGYLRIAQDATGSRTLSFGSDYLFAGGSAPVLSTAANALDLLFYCVLPSGKIFISSALDVK